jgi:hypothetical protein
VGCGAGVAGDAQATMTSSKTITGIEMETIRLFIETSPPE